MAGILNIYNKKRFLLLFLLLLSLISLLIICLRKFKPSKSLKSDNSLAFILILFFVSLIIKLIFIFAVNTKQFSDFQLFYWATADIAKKTPKYLSESYFSLWAYQAGFPALMSPIMKIFGINIIPLLITNCVFMSVKNIIIYLLLRMFLTEKHPELFPVLTHFSLCSESELNIYKSASCFHVALSGSLYTDL